MRVCYKCNNKVSFLSVVKSIFKKDGFIVCDNCNSKFKMKNHKIITMIIVFSMVVVLSLLNNYYITTYINLFVRTLLIVIITILIFIGLLFIVPWEEQ